MLGANVGVQACIPHIQVPLTVFRITKTRIPHILQFSSTSLGDLGGSDLHIYKTLRFFYSTQCFSVAKSLDSSFPLPTYEQTPTTFPVLHINYFII